jgi:hypothetical protein
MNEQKQSIRELHFVEMANGDVVQVLDEKDFSDVTVITPADAEIIDDVLKSIGSMKGVAKPTEVTRRKIFQYLLQLRAAEETEKKEAPHGRFFVQLFKAIELGSFIIPVKARREAFEPAYNNSKSDYLIALREHKRGLARKWLTTCFTVHVAGLVWFTFWNMCSEKGKKALWAAFGGVVVWFRGG